MWTFRDYLLEAEKTPAQVAQTLLDQCMPFINAIGELEFDNILYRGTNAKIEDFIPRERKEAGGVTGNYSGERGDMLRDYFKRKCNMNLDIIIFATGDPAIAKTFGNPYVIFPIGEFTYAYSKSGIALPYVDSEKKIAEANFVTGFADDNSDEGMADPNFQAAVASHSEVLIHAKSYLPISIAFWKQHAQAILEDLSFR